MPDGRVVNAAGEPIEEPKPKKAATKKKASKKKATK